MNKRKILNDPVYGFITIPTDLIFDLIEHRYFQRLRRIKQLGLTHYVYPGAQHTRFQHAIGAMHLMGQAIHTLRMKGHQISAEEEEGARIAILLHDIGHGPYSHALEHQILPYAHEVLTLDFMHLINAEFDGKLDLAIQIFEGTYPRKFLNQLVSGQLDMDRLDYLKRDSFYTGVAEGVIGHDRIIAMLNVVDDEVVVEEKAIFSIEKFLVARRLMYLQVYLHKAVISAEQMIRRLLEILRNSGVPAMASSPALVNLLTHDPGDAENHPPGLRFIETFALVDDVDIDFILKALARSEDSTLRMLANGLVNRRLFRTVFSSEPFSDDAIEAARKDVFRLLRTDQATADALVITGLEMVPTYDPGQGEIRFLRKDGTVAPLDEMLDPSMYKAVHQRHFLCYPAKI